MRCLVLFTLLLCCKLSLQSQNLVPNPSFDNLRGKRPNMSPWQMVNTIDYFVYDETKKDKVLKTKIKDKNFKLRSARTGNAYVGLRVWPRYTEFLVVELNEVLEPQQQYYFEMYMALSPHANSYLRSVGVSFYSFKPPYSQKKGIYDYPPQLVVYRHYGIIDTTDWYKVAGVFTAEGGERFMTIGNFSLNNKEKFKRKKFGFGKREAYYYIDDVALYKLDSFGYPIYFPPEKDSLIVVENNPNAINRGNHEVDDYYRVVHFPQSSEELTYEAYNKLGFIIDYLFKNPDVSLYIIGYAGPSDIQDESEMIKLAQKRARSAFIFITGNRINKNRINLTYSLSDCTDRMLDMNVRVPCNSIEILFSNDKEDLKRINSPFFHLMP